MLILSFSEITPPENTQQITECATIFAPKRRKKTPPGILQLPFLPESKTLRADAAHRGAKRQQKVSKRLDDTPFATPTHQKSGISPHLEREMAEEGRIFTKKHFLSVHFTLPFGSPTFQNTALGQAESTENPLCYPPRAYRVLHFPIKIHTSLFKAHNIQLFGKYLPAYRI